LTNDRVKCNQ